MRSCIYRLTLRVAASIPAATSWSAMPIVLLHASGCACVRVALPTALAVPKINRAALSGRMVDQQSAPAGRPNFTIPIDSFQLQYPQQYFKGLL